MGMRHHLHWTTEHTIHVLGSGVGFAHAGILCLKLSYVMCGMRMHGSLHAFAG